eukprot:TRINITY_DN10159_c0_g1_i2.p1 TRINITY_DN10159_c0_g1~~TRINITY_DN10159_c0_g1_i2.p1  ORF type:complete len:354 (+),score=110.44 TRINITY_DN10159_c0_g1_i2:88-1149(+)
MIRRPPRSTLSSSSAASDVYKRQASDSPRAAQALRIAGAEPLASSLLEHHNSQLVQLSTAVLSALTAPAVDQIEEFLETELSKIIGLQSVKQQLRAMLRGVRMNQKRKAQGFAVDGNENLHLAFIGSPGTGKTKFARLIPKLFQALGVIPSDSLVEVNREDLVASYVGQTAQLTKERINKARGGVLFVDEAYRLSEGSEHDFGVEAIETMMVEMTKPTTEHSVVFAFAGYTDKMEGFLRSNPGMERRIAYRFNFPDYSAHEMAQIVDVAIRSKGFRTSCSSEELAEVIETASTQQQRSLLNGGIADLLVPAAVHCLNQRLDETAEGAQLVTLELADLEKAASGLHWPSPAPPK